jgi:hypothetical protein
LSYHNLVYEKLAEAAVLESDLFDGQNPESNRLEDAGHWSSAYGELTGFKERLRLLTLMRYKGRKGFWEQRARDWS